MDARLAQERQQAGGIRLHTHTHAQSSSLQEQQEEQTEVLQRLQACSGLQLRHLLL